MTHTTELGNAPHRYEESTSIATVSRTHITDTALCTVSSLHTYIHTHTLSHSLTHSLSLTRTRTHAHARAHAHTHTHTHTHTVSIFSIPSTPHQSQHHLYKAHEPTTHSF